jgi:hypothetical protein
MQRARHQLIFHRIYHATRGLRQLPRMRETRHQRLLAPRQQKMLLLRIRLQQTPALILILPGPSALLRNNIRQHRLVLMALSPIQCPGFLPQNYHLMLLLWSILYEDKLCKMNLMHLSRTRRDILFHHELDSMSLILNGFLNSSVIPMALLLATKLVWWPRDSSSSMMLIMMLHSVPSSS